jgi:hypothetical protein
MTRAPTGLPSVVKPRICGASLRCSSVIWSDQTPSSRLALLATARFHSVGQTGRRSSALAGAALVCVVLAGCTDLPPVADTGCGNLVLNEEEDCDGFSAFSGASCGAPGTVHACFYVCDAAASEPLCPPGWGCGGDGRCRQPSGAFAPNGEAFRFAVTNFALGDVDGDGNLDLVGGQGSLLTTRYGAGDSTFITEEDILVPQPTGPLTYGYFDDDHRLDAIVPIAGGLFVLTGQEGGGLDPIAYSTIPVAVQGALRMIPLEAFAGELAGGELDRDTELLSLSEAGMLFYDSRMEILPEPYPDGNTLPQLASALAAGNVDGDALGLSEFALAFRNTTKVHICGVQPVIDQGLLTPDCRFQEVQTTGTVTLDGTMFADVDGDGYLDLLVGTADTPDQAHMEVALNTGNTLPGALFEAQSRPLCLPTMGSECAPWPLASGDFNRDGMADYVFPRAIAVARRDPGPAEAGAPDRLEIVAQASRGSWVDAVVVDINGDGWPDVAVAIEGVDGVDIYINASSAAGITVFNKFHIDTQNPPLGLRTGDFDGDLIADIAFREFGFGTEPERVSVIFGNASGGPSEAVTMARFDRVDALEPVLAPRRGLIGDFITDLLVVSSSRDRSQRAAALLQGDSSRRMLAPFFLGIGDDTPDIARAAIIGNFDSMLTAPDGAPVADVLAISGQPPDPDAPGEPESHAWLVRGTDGQGGLSLGDAPATDLPLYSVFDSRCAVWVVGDLDPPGVGNGMDEVIGIDNGVACTNSGNAFAVAGRMATVRMPETVGQPVEPVFQPLPSDYTVVRTARLHDLDGDGDLDLLVLFAGEYRAARDRANAAAAVVVFWNQDGTISPDDVSIIKLAGGQALYDAAPIQTDVDPEPEIAILAEGGVFLVKLEAPRQYSEPQWLFAQEGDGYMQVGDVNGDGLEDIVFTVAPNARVALQSAAPTRGAQFSTTSTPGGQP